MATKPYRFVVHEARSFTHPVFPSVHKYIFLVRAAEFPRDLPREANLRDSVGLNRRVYRDVRESLKAKEAFEGSFDLMNLGITIIADEVKMVDNTKKSFDVLINEDDGILNGGHTAAIIQECQDDGTVNEQQYVQVQIITGVDGTGNPELKKDMAKGQNTGIAVKEQSIYEKGSVFDRIKDIVAPTTWAADVAYRESDVGKIDVRHLIAVLEAINVIDYPNEGDGHPIQAYEKSSGPLKNYAQDYADAERLGQARRYEALEPLLLEALDLYDRIRHDFYGMYNQHVKPGAGHLKILEEAPKKLGAWDFPFSDQDPVKYRLTKGPAFAILGAFRNFVEYDSEAHKAVWAGGYKRVRKAWDEYGPIMVQQTGQAVKDIGRFPDVLGKSRPHWTNLHREIENRLLREKLKSVAG